MPFERFQLCAPLPRRPLAALYVGGGRLVVESLAQRMLLNAYTVGGLVEQVELNSFDTHGVF